MHPVHLAVTLVAVITGRALIGCGLVFCMGIVAVPTLVALDHFLSPPRQ